MGLSIWQILLILVLVLILFGAGKLPRVMKDIGKGIRGMKEGLKGEDEEETASTSKKISNNSGKKKK
ncbi:MAG: twin-arginine translocase TatA/TatE family subunit [Rickettsiales bacterium]|nr:twin-arginine translocase TatA/TatE family subunit [Rickettsiales bacterium]